MPSLFRRKSANLIDDTSAEVTTTEEAASRPKGYTPSKKELGKETPKRPSASRHAPGSKKPLTKEETRDLRRQERQEASARFRTEGGPRDRGPERGLVRDIVDSRRTAGTWFFGGALLVLLGSNAAMPVIVQRVSTFLWAALAAAVIIDAVLICRKVKRLVLERYPKTDQKMSSLYWYAVMRSLTFRRMRVPNPRVKLGEKI